MRPTFKALSLRIIGLAVCIVPPIITTLDYFPLWFSQTETTLSVLSAMLIALCCIPFYKQIISYFKGTPASWVVWLVIYIIVAVFNKLADGVETVAFMGVLSNLAGGFIFRLEKRIKAREGVGNE